MEDAGWLILPVTRSIAADLPIAADTLKKLYLSHLGFEYLCMASAFRRAAELGGLLESVEADKPVIILVTQAATGGRPLAVVNHLYEAIDLGKLDPELKNVTNPFTGREVFAIQFLKADIFIMQAQVSDEYGNGQYWGGTGHEREKAKAATIVIVQSPFLRPSLDRSVRQGRWRRAAAHCLSRGCRQRGSWGGLEVVDQRLGASGWLLFR